MKVYKNDELTIGKNYFFVFRGVVYYGECTGGKLDYDEPTAFEINDHTCDKFICNIWDTALIYTLDEDKPCETKEVSQASMDFCYL